MPNNNGIITAPISIGDVASVLGVGYYDLGRLCQSSNIKMWSKYKPVRWKNKPFVNSSPDWWKAEDGSCGIDFTNAKATNYAGVMALFTDDGLNGWKYNPPTGGDYDYRLLDFENYMQSAQPMIGGITVPSKVAVGGILSVAYDYNEGETEDGVPASLTFDDIDAVDGNGNKVQLSSYKFGVIVVDSNGNYKGRVLDGTGGYVEYNVTGLYEGSSYKVYPVLSQKSLGQYDGDVTNVMYTLPNVTPQTFTVVSKAEAQGLVIELMAWYTYTSGKASGVSWTLNVTNTNANSSKTFNSNTIQCRFTSSPESSGMLDGESSSTVTNFTVGAGQVVSKNGSFSLKYTTYPNKQYYVILYLNNSEFIERMDVEEDPDIEIN